ncbi:glycosyltransferase family 4 protein [Streptococcus massiliensis]|uniref:RgpG n=1 Tax=Streptococcus massiliensis TaxID=313439 RepID=A0A380L1S3_9STRE|nr:MraY family glycosyltransferase [Streptococcus massiliensis]SUN76550.1 RgpG [Streptococcus massiliensis]
MMSFSLKYVFVLIGTFLLAVMATPLVKLLAFRIGAVDYPNARRINKKPMPSSGGLAVVLAFSITSLFILPTIVPITQRGVDYFHYIWPVVLSGAIVALTGLIDDVKELSPRKKMAGIVLAASLIWFLTDFRLSNFKIPFGGPMLHFAPWLSFILTIIWIVSITNAMNLIDGLDGLVSGVSIISLMTMGLVSYFFLPVPNLFLTLTIFVLVAAIVGFFPYNYHPAIIYGGDTGALFIGFMIAVLSLQGLKNATAVAVVTPMIILGVPIADTFLAIVRRTLSGQKFYEPDKRHLHHRLLSLGLTHRGTVLVIYGISFLFAMISLLLNVSSRLGGILLIIGLLLGIELLAEVIGILGVNRTPLLNILRFIGNSAYREEVRQSRRKKQGK